MGCYCCGSSLRPGSCNNSLPGNLANIYGQQALQATPMGYTCPEARKTIYWPAHSSCLQEKQYTTPALRHTR